MGVVRRSVLALFAALALMLAVTGSAQAGSYTLNFDSLTPGAVVNSGGGGMTMPQNPIVFNAGAADAFNGTNGLRRAGTCPNSGQNCTTGDHRLEIHFGASSPASQVSMRVGAVFPYDCFEFSCPTIQLVGYRANGTVAATTARSYYGNHDLKALISINAFESSIRKAVLVFSGDPLTGVRSSGDGSQFTAQLDDLRYTVDEGEPPPPPPPPGPSITIESPASGGPLFADTDVTVSGSLNAPAGLSGFCLEANAPTGAIPANCDNTFGVTPRPGPDAFSLSRIPGMRPGINFVRAFARDGLGRAASDSISVRVADGSVDFLTETIELTQGVQVDELPRGAPGMISGLGSLFSDEYDGVPLSDDKTTLARVYSAARGADSPVIGASAQLRGYRRSGGGLVELPSSPLRPHFSPPTILSNPDLAVQRADPQGAFNFLLPSTWTRPGREVVLVAETEAVPAGSPTPDCCVANNRFGLTGIEFTDTRDVTTYTVPLPYTDSGGTLQTLSSPHSDHFDMQRTVWPGRVNIVQSLAAVDVTDVIADGREGFDAVDGFKSAINEAHGDSRPPGKILGLNPTNIVCAGKGSTPIGATGCADRSPLLLTHESGHTYGLAHAMRNGACDDNRLIGARADRQPLNGVGIDLRFWSGGTPGAFQPLAEEKAGVFDATPDASPNIYDYMSYCALGSTGWVSADYWATTVRELARGGRIDIDYGGDCCFLGAASDPTVSRARTREDSGAEGDEAKAAAVGEILDVGFTFRSYAPFAHEITMVERNRGKPFVEPVPDPDTTVRVVVLDGAGGQISSTPVPLQVEGGASLNGLPEKPSAVVRAAVESSAAAQRVEIRSSGGGLLAARDASPAAPKAKLKRPKAGKTIRSKGKFKASWTRSDADGDALSSRLQYSSDRGKSWETLASSLPGKSVRIPGKELPRTSKRKGRLRVIVSDGFNTAISQVKKVGARGSGPEATIVSPDARSLKVLGDTNLRLEGEAFDDAGKLLEGKKLKWTSGKRKLGRGTTLDVPVYKLGRKLKLTATDRSGRRGSDTLKLKVRKVAPELTLLEPRKLGSKAKTLKLRAAAAVPSKVKISGRGLKRKKAKLGPKAKTLKVRTKGKRLGTYQVKLTLTAAGKRSRVSVVVERG